MLKNIFILLFTGCIYQHACSSNNGSVTNKAPVVEGMMQKYHSCPRLFDDQLCADVLREFLHSLDPSHLYLISSDIKQLSDLNSVKAEISGTGNDFLTNAVVLYRDRLNKADSLVEAILQKPFDFSSNETVTLNGDSGSWAGDENELRSRWFRFLKYETLHRMSDIKYYDSTATKDYLLQQQRGLLKIVSKTEDRKVKRILDNPAGYENYISSLFCNALTTSYDPHSEYFPPAQKENFEGEINGGGYAFGFDLEENDKGDVEISHLVPGSPAWKCGQLNQHDVLLKMEWENKPQVDLAGADVTEVEELLASENHKKLRLTVHKDNGLPVTVTLEKEMIQNDEDVVKSYVLKGPRKIGYILLPGFYSEWESAGSGSCANDVAKEVLKLKKENIDGLVLDLRYNGGGSMEEAIQLAGIFIDEGTMAFSKEKNERPHALKDPNRGTLYDGPLVVLVNGESASASELVAAALQDYNRAVIVGSPTFGKATFQMVVPADTQINLDKVRPAELNNPKRDYVKITTGRFYRPTGRSHQNTGVQPDIALPDLLDNVGERESNLPHALLPDSVKRAIIFNPLPSLPLRELAAKSAARVNASGSFKLVNQGRILFSDMYSLKKKTIPLNFDAFMALSDTFSGQSIQIIHTLEQDSLRSFKAENYGADISRMALGGYESEQNTRFLSFVMHDIYINESFLILADYINLKR